jgi:hypothetical protein
MKVLNVIDLTQNELVNNQGGYVIIPFEGTGVIIR